jgi:hypothetical protein
MPDSAILTFLAALMGLMTAAGGLIAALVRYRTSRLKRLGEVAIGEREAKSLLPTQTKFVNRDEEIDEAFELIGSGEIVLAIEGEAGIGKTAIATELAHRLKRGDGAEGPLDLSGRTFVWFDCEGRCPDLTSICSVMARLTGDQSLSAVAEAEKLDALRVHLAGQESVLVLDDLKLNEDSESAELQALLRSVPSGSLVIASVDRPDKLGAARLPLAELTVPHLRRIAQLQARRLRLDCIDALDEDFARRLREVVGGNPGMIEWFLESFRLSSRTLEQHLDAVELGEARANLQAPTWEGLGGRAQLALAACACLGGQALEEQLQVGCGLAEPETAVAIEELIEAGCLRTVRITGEPILYTCSRALRQHAIVATSEATVRSIASRLLLRRAAARRSRERARSYSPHHRDPGRARRACPARAGRRPAGAVPGEP